MDRWTGGMKEGYKKRASYPYHTATTFYRCCLPALTEFEGSWLYGTCPEEERYGSGPMK